MNISNKIITVTRFNNFGFLKHLFCNAFDMFVIYKYTLESIYFLNFFDHIFSKSFDAENIKNVSWRWGAINNHITFANLITLIKINVSSFRNQIFNWLTFFWIDNYSSFTFNIFSKFYCSRNFSENSRVFWFS